jgi:DNA-binding winged helix-turn-helix (wHTH) protein
VIYRFNDYELDTQRYQLCRSGKPVNIEPQVFDLLIYLVANRKKLVSRDELFDSIWSGKIVTDTSLSNHIKSARKAIGDNGRDQNSIN